MQDDLHERNRAVWDGVADAWVSHRDFMWKTTRHVAEWLVAHVDPEPGDVILDLAGGPGDNGFLVARRLQSSGTVIVTDFAPRMVEVARRRAEELRLHTVETRVVDGADMDLDDDSIDGIVCRWGLMLMLDPQAALDECRRVLKEGGRLALSVWAGPDKNPWVTVTGLTIAGLGYPPARDPFGPGGMFSLAESDKLRAMLAAAGFSDVDIEEMPVDWSFDSFEDLWTYQTEVSSAFSTFVRDLDLDEVKRVRDALEANIEPFRTDAGITLPGMTVNASAS